MSQYRVQTNKLDSTKEKKLRKLLVKANKIRGVEVEGLTKKQRLFQGLHDIFSGEPEQENLTDKDLEKLIQEQTAQNEVIADKIEELREEIKLVAEIVGGYTETVQQEVDISDVLNHPEDKEKAGKDIKHPFGKPEEPEEVRLEEVLDEETEEDGYKCRHCGEVFETEKKRNGHEGGKHNSPNQEDTEESEGDQILNGDFDSTLDRSRHLVNYLNEDGTSVPNIIKEVWGSYGGFPEDKRKYDLIYKSLEEGVEEGFIAKDGSGAVNTYTPAEATDTETVTTEKELRNYTSQVERVQFLADEVIDSEGEKLKQIAKKIWEDFEDYQSNTKEYDFLMNTLERGVDEGILNKSKEGRENVYTPIQQKENLRDLDMDGRLQAITEKLDPNGTTINTLAKKFFGENWTQADRTLIWEALAKGREEGTVKREKEGMSYNYFTN